MSKVFKKDLIDKLVNKHGMTKAAARDMLDRVIDVISGELLAGNDVGVSGLGTFKIKERSARECRNPNNGKKVRVEAHKVVTFKAESGLRDLVK